MDIHTLSLFPTMFEALNQGIPARAKEKGLLRLTHHNPRDFTTNVHRTVDDRPYGGGPGMVMMVDPLKKALEQAKKLAQSPPKVVYLSPQGIPLQQSMLQSAVDEAQPLVLVCGRYEGVDERFIHGWVDEEWSLGDYVLSGGELAAMVVIDGIARLITGVLGHEASAAQDSFAQGLLDYPHYTRPECYEGSSVPQVLLNGHHDDIRQWRMAQALKRTWQKRPDLLEGLSLTEEQKQLLGALKNAIDNEENEETIK